MDIASLLSAIPLPPDVQRWIAYATVALTVLTTIAKGLDWISPKLKTAAESMAIRAASTPGHLDDQAARGLASVARLAAQLAVILSSLVDVLRAVLPRASVTIAGRSISMPSSRPPAPPAVLSTPIVLLVVLTGCGPSVSTVRRQYEATTTRCVSDLHKLEAECPGGPECLARLSTLRAECDHELASICNQGRRARRVCP